jgi:membrane protease YdiL (CAAX protease family)
MNPITSFIKRHPQGVFWAIAYSIPWLGYVLSRMYPNDLWQLFVWGPFLGGALVTAIADGRSGFKTYFSRIVRWRVGFRWYAVALFLPLAINAAAIGLNLATGAKLEQSVQLPALPQVAFFFLFIFFTIALGEEPGFRGFALPRLLVGRSALAASLILGVLHAIWHLPLFLGGEMPAVSTTLIILSGSVMFTWLFNRTNGSVLIAMIFHTTVDLSAQFFSPLFSGANAASMPLWQAVAYLATAILICVLAGRELGRRLGATADTLATKQPGLAG